MTDINEIEQRILDLKDQGLGRAKIAKLLGVSEHKVRTTVRSHIVNEIHKRERKQNTQGNLRLAEVSSSKPKIKKTVVLSDIHIPYHDQKALAVAISYMEDYKPDEIILNGDILDNYSCSSYRKDEARFIELQDELDEVKSFLSHLRELFPKAKMHYVSGNHECFSEDTEILTEKGWVSFPSLKDEKVASYSYTLDKIEYSQPLATQAYPYSGVMYSIKNTYTDLLITPNHRLLYKIGNTRNEWKMEEIQNIPLKENRVCFKSSTSSSNPEYDLSDTLISLAGWLITDGSLVKDKRVIFYQRNSKVHLIEELLNSAKLDYTKKIRNRDIKEICGKALKSIESQCELYLTAKSSKELLSLVKDKISIPEWVYNLSERQFDVFLSSCIDGDGSRHNSAPETSLMLYGVKELLDSFQKVCLHFGYRTSLYTYRDTQYRLNITKNEYCTLDRFGSKVSQTYYNGNIYCVTTNNDTVIVRRNGKISITGNSRTEKIVADKAHALSTLKCLAIDELLELPKYNIQYVDSNSHVDVADVEVFHGDMCRKGSGASAKAHHDKTGGSVLIGHVHKLAVLHKTNKWGTHVFIENGHLGREDFEYINRPDWQQGFTVIESTEDGKRQIKQHFIQDGILLADGKEYIAQ